MPSFQLPRVDLAVADVEASLAFYLNLLGPLGWAESDRYPTYRGTEEVVYLKDPATGSMLGIRPADGGAHRYYEVESTTSPSRLTGEMRLTTRTHGASRVARGFTSHPRRIATWRTTTRSSHSIPTGFESRCSAGAAQTGRSSRALS
jgi:catechol 2,3-dioxygenase-like lactoylglutathione lyase family enzyme